MCLENIWDWHMLHCRCVKGEGEMEKLQAKVVEMRQKLEDTTAAMQELGRENQSLQVRVWLINDVTADKAVPGQ